MTTNEINYKVTYNADTMNCEFVRIKDDAILYSNPNEIFVIMFARGFCTAKDTNFYIE